MIEYPYDFSSYFSNFDAERDSSMLFILQEKGQGLVEYAIILAFVAIVVIAILRLMGPAVGNVFSTINSSFDSF